jgi:hypothetical protein
LLQEEPSLEEFLSDILSNSPLHEVGTHSLRASFALMMALMNIPDSRIILG